MPKAIQCAVFGALSRIHYRARNFRDAIAMSGRQGTGIKLLEAVNAPLGFFVLALLIVESFLAAAMLGGSLNEQHQLTVLCMGVGMFLIVIAAVTILVWKKPENLTFDKQAHLVRSQAEYGTDAQAVENRDALLPSESERTNGP